MGENREKVVGKLKFEKSSEIGRSNGTIVYKGKYEESIDVAIKRIQTGDASVEIDVLKKCHSHPNVVKYYVTEKDDDFNYIGIELCKDTLENLVNNKYQGQSVGSKLEILKQITQGLEYLHSNNVVHRDIKPQNILISYPHGSVPPLMKLADFGISRVHRDGRSDLTKTGSSGTLGWIAPEFYNPKVESYTSLADIFPLGCIFCYLLSDGNHPFGDEKDLRQGNIKSGNCCLPTEKLKKFDHALELISAMLDPIAEKRPTSEQVLEHPFFDPIQPRKNQVTNASMTSPEKIKKISQLFDEQLKSPVAVLGKGSCNTVVCKVLYNKNWRAIKRIDKTFNDTYINEITLLSDDRLDCTHVVRYYNSEHDKLYWYIIMELCDCSLTYYIDKDRSSKPDSDLLKQIVQGLAYLHQITIVHRDIKPSNVLVILPSQRTQYKPLLKLADFGISKKLDIEEKDVTTKRRGSTGWMAPELFATPAEYTKAVDVFAAGLVLFYAVTNGSHPFVPDDSSAGIGTNLNLESCQDSIKKGKQPNNLKLLEDKPDIYNLVDWMIQSKFQDRPVITKVLKHPYFWDAKDGLDFIRKVSEKIEGAKADSPFIKSLENLKDQLFSPDWQAKLTPHILKNLNLKRREYPYIKTDVSHLLRVIRNKHAHYETLTKEEKNEFGGLPEKYLNYWLSRFPKLLVLTWPIWDALQQKEPHEENLVGPTVPSLSSDSHVTELEPLLNALTLIPTVNEPSENALPIWDCAWNPVKNNLLVSVSLDSTTCLWDISEISPKKKIFQLKDHHVAINKSLLTVSWNKNGEIIAAGNSVGDVIFWNADGSECFALPKIMKSSCRRLEFHSSKDLMLGISSSKLMVWSEAKNPLRNSNSTEWTHAFDTINCASFNKLTPIVAVCGLILDLQGSRFAIQIIQVQENGSLQLLREIHSAHDEKIYEVKWQIGGGSHFLATCSHDKSVKVWWSYGILKDQNLYKHEAPVTTIEWNPINLILASASVDGTIHIWDTSKGTCLHSLNKAHQRTIKALVFSPDGKMLASAGGFDKLINVWKLKATKDILDILPILSKNVRCRINKLAWNCDASKLGAALNNGTVSFNEINASEF